MDKELKLLMKGLISTSKKTLKKGLDVPFLLIMGKGKTAQYINMEDGFENKHQAILFAKSRVRKIQPDKVICTFDSIASCPEKGTKSDCLMVTCEVKGNITTCGVKYKKHNNGSFSFSKEEWDDTKPNDDATMMNFIN